MDDDRFDDLARHWAAGVPRRSVLKGAAGGLLAAALTLLGVAGGASQEVGIAACNPIGTRCGRRKQPSCNTCCSGYATRQRNGQRRCACRPDSKRCDRSDQCCSGLCCRIEGEGKICIPGLFCGGRCPEPNGSCP